MDGAPALLTLAAALLAAVAMVSHAALRAWHGWLDLRRAQIEACGARRGGIDLTGIRERVRRLEAIASGADG